MKTKTFRISLEIGISAENPLEAAKELERWIKDGDNFQYYVQDENEKLYSVDLNEDDEDAVLEINDYTPIITPNL
jgi:hypothetical protein